MIENVGGSGAASGFDASETTVLLTKTLETGDKRERRRQLGDSRLERAEIEIALREASVAAEVARRYVRVLQIQETIDLLDESVAIAARTLGVVEKRDPAWLARWLREPDVMIEEGDPIALEILARYGNLQMPNLSLEELAETPVTSVAGTEKPWFQTPSALHVIRHEDIARSGLPHLPEVLRPSPGVDSGGGGGVWAT